MKASSLDEGGGGESGATDGAEESDEVGAAVEVVGAVVAESGAVEEGAAELITVAAPVGWGSGNWMSALSMGIAGMGWLREAERGKVVAL